MMIAGWLCGLCIALAVTFALDATMAEAFLLGIGFPGIGALVGLAAE